MDAVRGRRGGGLAAASLILLFAAGGLWARGAGGTHGHALAVFVNGGRVGGLISSRGQMLLIVTNVRLDERRAWTVEAREVGEDDARALVVLLQGRAIYAKGRGGFAWMRGVFSEVPGSWYLAVGAPHALLVGLFAVAPLLWVKRSWRRRRRGRRGLCLACGYDLRASEGRCPECGSEPGGVPAEVGKPA